MILNIVDNRVRRYRWRRVNAIIEATWHDNTCNDSDQTPELALETDLLFAKLDGVSVAEAVSWAHEEQRAVTLFLYDDGA